MSDTVSDYQIFVDRLQQHPTMGSVFADARLKTVSFLINDEPTDITFVHPLDFDRVRNKIRSEFSRDDLESLGFTGMIDRLDNPQVVAGVETFDSEVYLYTNDNVHVTGSEPPNAYRDQWLFYSADSGVLKEYRWNYFWERYGNLLDDEMKAAIAELHHAGMLTEVCGYWPNTDGTSGPMSGYVVGNGVDISETDTFTLNGRTVSNLRCFDITPDTNIHGPFHSAFGVPATYQSKHVIDELHLYASTFGDWHLRSYRTKEFLGVWLAYNSSTKQLGLSVRQNSETISSRTDIPSFVSDFVFSVDSEIKCCGLEGRYFLNGWPVLLGPASSSWVIQMPSGQPTVETAATTGGQICERIHFEGNVKLSTVLTVDDFAFMNRPDHEYPGEKASLRLKRKAEYQRLIDEDVIYRVTTGHPVTMRDDFLTDNSACRKYLRLCSKADETPDWNGIKIRDGKTVGDIASRFARDPMVKATFNEVVGGDLRPLAGDLGDDEALPLGDLYVVRVGYNNSADVDDNTLTLDPYSDIAGLWCVSNERLYSADSWLDEYARLHRVQQHDSLVARTYVTSPPVPPENYSACGIDSLYDAIGYDSRADLDADLDDNHQVSTTADSTMSLPSYTQEEINPAKLFPITFNGGFPPLGAERDRTSKRTGRAFVGADRWYKYVMSAIGTTSNEMIAMLAHNQFRHGLFTVSYGGTTPLGAKS